MHIDRERSSSAIEVRTTTWAVLIAFVAANTVLVLLSLTKLHPHFFALAGATRHALNVNLISFALIAVTCIGGILILAGGMRLRDLGLRREHVPLAAITTVFVWVLLQVVLIGHAAITGDFRLHPQWADPGLIPMIGFFIAMLLGAALVEEVAFRGYVFPQLWAKCGGSYVRRILIAAVASQVLFALMHVPTRLLIGGHSMAQLMPSLTILTFAGLYGVLMYLRTGNLLVVIGIHALINAPGPIVETAFPPMFVVIVIGLALLVFWPRITRSPIRWHRLELESKTEPSPVEATR